jgi:hypothetical protein
MVVGGVINIRRFMRIDPGIRVKLREIPQQFEKLQFWYY